MTTDIEVPSEVVSDESPAEALRARIEQRINVPPWILLIQLFIGFGWIRAVVEKVIDFSWWNGEVLSGFLLEHADLTLSWYQPLLDAMVEPNLIMVSIVVVLAQIVAGVTLLSGRRVLLGLAVGSLLNLNFIAAGAVSPSVFYLICQASVLLWILHGEDGVKKRPLRLLATASSAVALLNLPFVSTFDPQAVIEDPATILVTFGVLTAVASSAGVRSSTTARLTG
ncbi:MAG: hypothetical protein HKN91_08515 [Acidimicrobiia bacterium]|nr:hypothetical protein [Acidimicrobiia bacterium]